MPGGNIINRCYFYHLGERTIFLNAIKAETFYNAEAGHSDRFEWRDPSWPRPLSRTANRLGCHSRSGMNIAQSERIFLSR